jgi:integrase
MGLYRKGKVWYAAFNAEGRKLNRSTKTTNKRVAQKILNRWKGDVVSGQFDLLRPDAPTLREYLEKYINAIKNDNSRLRYQFSAANLNEFFRNARVNHITTSRIEGFKEARLAQGVKNSSVNRDLALARACLRRAARERFIARSPFENGGIFLNEKNQCRQPQIMSFEQEEQLIANCSPFLRALVRLITETGLRSQKEALQLKWENVDFENGVIHVCASKSPAGLRTLPMSQMCKEELLRWKTLTGPAFSVWVFPNMKVPAKHVESVKTSWKTALRKAGIPYRRIYDLRHVFATRLAGAGTPDTILAGMLGHSSTNLVRTYARMTDEIRLAAIKRLEAVRTASQKSPEAAT